MLVSVIIPAYRAQNTLARAVKSMLSQTLGDFEVIVVADDDVDYRDLLVSNGVDDKRLRFTSTGRIASGCHNARNVGLAAASGGFIAALDADDVFLPERLSVLLSLARADGAATDNPRVVADSTGTLLYRAFPDAAERQHLDIVALLDCTVPLFPLVAREHAQPRLPGIELGEDFVANLRLIDRLGTLTVCPETLSEYRVLAGSLAHNDTSAEGFEKSYSALITRLESGDRLGLSGSNAKAARDALIRKRDFNRAFATARADNPVLDFQTFVASRR
jgi:glycosyltransferase involved in cell wall biosynthesis